MKSLDSYEERPAAMNHYLFHYGWHFNKKMLKFALKHLPKESEIYNKEKVDKLLETYNIEIKDCLYDYIYVLNYAVCMYYGSSITTEKQLALFIKDALEVDDLIFTTWYASMCRLGIPINWDDMF